MKRLLKQRTIFIYEGVSAKLAKQVATALTLMEEDDAEKPITVYINSPGGSADSGFAIYDWLRFVKPPVRTVVAGMCASAGITIFLGGDDGMRMSMPNSRFMLHQPSTQTWGQASDIEVTAKEIIKIKARYNEMVAQATGKSLKEVEKDVDRDFWLSADEAKAYGLVQKIVSKNTDLG
jgi:ATP-dependent Clp protease protease subunit